MQILLGWLFTQNCCGPRGPDKGSACNRGKQFGFLLYHFWCLLKGIVLWKSRQLKGAQDLSKWLLRTDTSRTFAKDAGFLGLEEVKNAVWIFKLACPACLIDACAFQAHLISVGALAHSLRQSFLCVDRVRLLWSAYGCLWLMLACELVGIRGLLFDNHQVASSLTISYLNLFGSLSIFYLRYNLVKLGWPQNFWPILSLLL